MSHETRKGRPAQAAPSKLVGLASERSAYTATVAVPQYRPMARLYDAAATAQVPPTLETVQSAALRLNRSVREVRQAAHYGVVQDFGLIGGVDEWGVAHVNRAAVNAFFKVEPLPRANDPLSTVEARRIAEQCLPATHGTRVAASAGIGRMIERLAAAGVALQPEAAQ